LEKVRDHFRLVDEPFEVGNVLTPTLKLKRSVAKNAYINEINEMYAETDNQMNA
jgi:long-subunit acyl-CoA synthetase (AMP-forming)